MTNVERVRNALRDEPWSTSVDIAKDTGLSLVTVRNAITAMFEAEDLVRRLSARQRKNADGELMRHEWCYQVVEPFEQEAEAAK